MLEELAKMKHPNVAIRLAVKTGDHYVTLEKLKVAEIFYQIALELDFNKKNCGKLLMINRKIRSTMEEKLSE